MPGLSAGMVCSWVGDGCVECVRGGVIREAERDWIVEWKVLVGVYGWGDAELVAWRVKGGFTRVALVVQCIWGHMWHVTC